MLASIQAYAFDQATVFLTDNKVLIFNKLKCELDPTMQELYLVKPNRIYYRGCWSVEHSLIHIWIKDLNYTTHIERSLVKFKRHEDYYASNN